MRFQGGRASLENDASGCAGYVWAVLTFQSNKTADDIKRPLISDERPLRRKQ